MPEELDDVRRERDRLLTQQRLLQEELRKVKQKNQVQVPTEDVLRRLLKEDDPESFADFGVEDFGSVSDLFNELRTGFACLERDFSGTLGGPGGLGGGGSLVRVVETVAIKLSYKKASLVLVESHEQLPDGRLFFSKNLLPTVQKNLFESCEGAAERYLDAIFSNASDGHPPRHGGRKTVATRYHCRSVSEGDSF